MEKKYSNGINRKQGKMIPVCLVIFSLMRSIFCHAQDTIQLLSGKIIFGDVFEISSTEIKYKKVENLKGLSYIEFKKDVEFIKYRNGEKEQK